MDRFYIEKLIVSGTGHNPSVIDFKPGLNFILGPSNTGKSLIMDCIDYVFGFQPKKDRPSKIVDNNHGYQVISLHLRTPSGSVILERTIGTNKINVTGTDPSIQHETYSVNSNAKKNINTVFLHLMGIDEPHRIRSSQEGNKTQALTWRSMLHLFFIKQADVARETSALFPPNGVGSTASAAILLFLLTGEDANDLTALEDPKLVAERKRALTAYIRDKLSVLSAKREKLEKILTDANIDVFDINSSIEFTREEIAQLQDEINAAAAESRKLMSELYEQNGKLSECRTIRHNFDVLHRQYQSDIHRIGFIVDGAANMVPTPKKVICPVCGEETTRLSNNAFLSSSTSELEKIRRHMEELSYAQATIAKREKVIESRISKLESDKDSVDKMISYDLQPRLAAFQNRLDEQLDLIRTSSELEVVRDDETQYRSELFDKETEALPERQTHSITGDFPYDLIKGFEEKLKSILTESKIGGASSSRFNMETFDVEIDGLKKSVSMGGGFCGILNTITALAMNEYLLELDRPAPGFYAVDSSLTQLSEAPCVAQADSVKQNFIRYLISNALSHQVIIVEQSDRMPFVPEENETGGVHVIEFSRDKNSGRYGFLNDVYNAET